MVGRYTPFESYINLLKPMLEGKFSTDQDEFFVAITAAYWALYGKFELINSSCDFDYVASAYGEILALVNSEESQDRLTQ